MELGKGAGCLRLSAAKRLAHSGKSIYVKWIASGRAGGARPHAAQLTLSLQDLGCQGGCTLNRVEIAHDH